MPFAQVNGVVLHYRLSGPADGPPVVLANSLGTDARIWDRVIAPLSSSYRIVSFDKRGHGLSDAPSGPYSLDDLVGDTVGLADYLHLDKFALAGISVGGLAAQGFALKHPERLKALVLCDTAARMGDQAMWAARIARVEAEGMGAIADAVLDRWFSRAYFTAKPAELAGWRNMLMRMPAPGYVATCAALRDTDLREQVSAIKLKTLVVVGGEDVSSPPELVEATARLLPDAQFRIIAGSGHIPSIEEPKALVELMSRYFEEVGYA